MHKDKEYSYQLNGHSSVSSRYAVQLVPLLRHNSYVWMVQILMYFGLFSDDDDETLCVSCRFEFRFVEFEEFLILFA